MSSRFDEMLNRLSKQGLSYPSPHQSELTHRQMYEDPPQPMRSSTGFAPIRPQEVSPVPPPLPPQSMSHTSRGEVPLSHPYTDALLREADARHRAEIAKVLQEARIEIEAAQHSPEIDYLRHELQRQKAALSEATRLLATPQDPIPDHTHQAEIDRVTLLLTAKEHELDAAKKKADDIEKRERGTIINLSNVAKQKHDLELKVEKLTAERELERQKRTASENRCVELESKYRQGNQGNSVVAALNKDVQNLRTMNRALADKEEAQMQRISGLETERAKLVDKQTMMRDQLSALRQTVDELEAGRQDQTRLQKDKDGLKRRLAEADETIEKTQREVRRLQRQVDKLDKEKREVKEELAEFRSRTVTERDARHIQEAQAATVSKHAPVPIQVDQSPANSTVVDAQGDMGNMPPQMSHDGRHERHETPEAPMAAPVPRRSLADIPALVAQSTYAPSFAPSDDSLNDRPQSQTTRPTLDDLRAAFARPKPPADPYASLGQAFGAASIHSDSFAGYNDGIRIEPDLIQHPNSSPSRRTQAQKEEQATAWDRLYGQVTSEV